MQRRTSNISADPQATPSEANESPFSTRATTASEIAIVRVNRPPVKVAVALQMHHTLRLRSPRIEDCSGFPKKLEHVSILRRDLVPPSAVSGGLSQAFHTKHLLDADR